MLSLSKHGGAGLYAHTLRQAQGDKAQEKRAMLRWSKHGAVGLYAFTVLFYLFLSINAVAQSKSDSKNGITSKAKTIYQLYEEVKKQPDTSDPLVMVNDSVYTGDIQKINSEDVAGVDIIKGGDAKAIWGAKAKNGVFMIKTKNYDDPSKAITQPGRKFLNGSVLYVVDEMPIPKELVTTNDILIKEVVTGEKLRELESYSHKRLDSAIFITTKKYAAISYKMKFSAVSEKYKHYMAMHQRKDDSCSYVLNGIILTNHSDETSKKLYSIKTQEIKEIGILENPWYNGGESRKYLVLITTKQ